MKRSIVLIAGWGQTACACQPLLDALAGLAEVKLVLPRIPLERVLDDITHQVRAAMHTASAVLLLGWSLGGLLAIRWLTRQSQAEPQGLPLCLLCVNPRFTADAQWPGVPSAVFEAFAEQLDRDPESCLLRFQALQVKGDGDATKELKRLRRHCAEPAGGIDHATLAATLAWLRDWDMRAALANLTSPVLSLLGDGDALVPSVLAERFGANVHVERIAGMGHYPGCHAAPRIAALIGDWWQA